jgi:hypothetical protein
MLGVEFEERYKLDEFLLVREELEAEVARFVNSEMRERSLRRKLDAFARISDAAPALLGCRTVNDLVGVLSRVVATVLECERTSVRLQPRLDSDDMVVSHNRPPGERDEAWLTEDEERYEKLKGTGDAYTLAFLDFEAVVRSGPGEYHSLVAFPIQAHDRFHGGIIAYDKRPEDPIEDAVFTELDADILKHLSRLILPVLDAIYSQSPTTEAADADTYETLLAQNLERFTQVCTNEIARSDRYHNTFAMVMFRVEPLAKVFAEDAKEAFRLIDEVTQGIHTRTRKTDYGCWIDNTTYVMLSLEGGNRIRFLVARAMTYMDKDLGHVGGSRESILVGTATYPGSSRTADQLLDEARADLKPYKQSDRE